ncbi:hypothetical protein CDAR_165931 [Caerostris darwini]|uniref:Uncharacterized protein n=1 Tax=Caerostris darwini TaxID=1538125 RepID=A0AAV4RXT1_9ARAC|nr:hypothetical protein CDAR_165931 [Caerostris darwini]
MVRYPLCGEKDPLWCAPILGFSGLPWKRLCSGGWFLASQPLNPNRGEKVSVLCRPEPSWNPAQKLPASPRRKVGRESPVSRGMVIRIRWVVEPQISVPLVFPSFKKLHCHKARQRLGEPTLKEN